MSGINLKSPTGFTTAVLIADTIQSPNGSNDAISSLTAVAGVPVNAALEIQSTTGALLLPRMTTAQKNALTTVVNGMQVFDTTLGAISYFVNGVWGTASSAAGAQSLVVTLNQAAVQGMYATPFAIIPAPAAGYSIVIDNMTMVTNFVTTAFAGGGVGVLQYGNSAHGAGLDALSATIPAAEFTATSSQFYTLRGATSAAVTGVAATGIFLSNQTAPFTGGNVASTIVVNVRYQVIAANV